MNMILIFMGVSGCGKTTIGKMTAETLAVPYSEGDEYHPKKNVEKMSHGIPLTDEDRDLWLQRLSELIQKTLDERESGVLSCSALKKKYRDQLRVDHDKVHFIYLKGSYECIRERMQKRTDHYMPADLLRSQFETLEEPDDIFTIEIDQTPEKILAQVMSYITTIIYPSED